MHVKSFFLHLRCPLKSNRLDPRSLEFNSVVCSSVEIADVVSSCPHSSPDSDNGNMNMLRNIFYPDGRPGRRLDYDRVTKRERIDGSSQEPTLRRGIPQYTQKD